MAEETLPEQQIESLSLTSIPPVPNKLSLEERFKLIRSIGEECIQEEELLNLLDKKPQPICYDGFEPSGRMHIAQQLHKIWFLKPQSESLDSVRFEQTLHIVEVRIASPNCYWLENDSACKGRGCFENDKCKQTYLRWLQSKDIISGGCKVKIWVADWFVQLNNKMGGDLKKIQTVGEYLIEIWKAAGMNQNGVEFLWSSKEINSRADKYWPLVMDIARRNKLPRIMRCCQIMGRSEQDELSAAQIFYPCMQCADIFFLEADIYQLGMDQRKVNVLAREYWADIKRKNKPIILSHHMLPGLQQGQEKMSKSDPSSAIYMEDEEAEVNVKIKKAYCPPKIVEGNPCLEYIKYIIFPWFQEFEVERNEKNGGNKTFKSYEELAADYKREELHPADLKPALSKALNRILQPVRDHFKNDPKAKDLLKKVKSYRVTK